MLFYGLRVKCEFKCNKKFQVRNHYKNCQNTNVNNSITIIILFGLVFPKILQITKYRILISMVYCGLFQFGNQITSPMGRRIWKWVSSSFILFGDEAQIGCFKYIYMKKKRIKPIQRALDTKNTIIACEPQNCFWWT